jgi:hypothetical protein
MDIKIFKWILNILIVPLMTICLSMIINGDIIGIILFIISIFMDIIINVNNKDKRHENRFN